MSFIADLHIHSSYSRATSRDMLPEALWKWAQVKGIAVMGSGDFTHPAWLGELRGKMEPLGNGLFGLKKKYAWEGIPDSVKSNPSFLLSAEISCIYRKKERTRKVHCIIFAPGFDEVGRINDALSKIGNLRSDGRPILGLDAKELLRIVMDASDRAMLVPAHAWTPHFSVFGAQSGFDSLEECFGELTPHIHAIETGLSSDPPMNWRISGLDRLSLISNSDAHSPAKIGREANIFDGDVSYPVITEAIKTKKGFLGTIEFFPQEGKYYYDGHRACGARLSPGEASENNCLCPVCGKKMTIGVLHRAETLADRDEQAIPEGAPPYYPLIPLVEVLAEALGVGPASKTVDKAYWNLIENLGNEFSVLMDVPLDEIERAGSPRICEAISAVRTGNVHIQPGYDGEYGKITIFDKKEAGKGASQDRRKRRNV